MRAHEILTEEQLNELDWRKGLATGAMALGALGAMGSAQARVTPDHDPSINRLTGKPNVTQVAPTQQPSAQMPNQNLDSAEKVERSADGIVVHYGGKEYQGVEVSKDGPQGGTSMNGDALKSEAQADMEKLEEDLKTYSEGGTPLGFIIG